MPVATFTVTGFKHSFPAFTLLPQPARLNPAAVSALPLADRALFERNGFGPRRPVYQHFVHRAFEQHAASQPDVLAVEHPSLGQSLTYAELDRKANRLARRLRRLGIRPGKRVCLLMKRSVFYVLSILAVLKAGAQYVPLDADTISDAMLEHVLGDCKPDVVLVMGDYAHRVEGVRVMRVEDVVAEDETRNADSSKPVDLSSPDDGIYIIYTSGTTGLPKGVDVCHRGVANVLSGPPGNVNMRPGLRVAQLLNIAFDMCAWEVLGSMYNGCTLCLRGSNSKEWVALMKTVDIVISTPSILSRHNPADYPGIKHVIVGGEVCPQALADDWARHTQFNNCCGPTEISVANTVQPHTRGYPLSIGTPIPNTNVYVLGRDPLDLAPLPIGEVGCMWVGGVGVSRGYLNLPEKTAERWRADPFVQWDGTGERPMMFNTCDLGRWRADGQLDHCGRADDQVKISGFRVELDGVGSAMATHPGVISSIALKVDDDLWGFVTPASISVPSLRETTAHVLPSYAVPKQFLTLDTLPLTPRGKVDKADLRLFAEREMAAQKSAAADAAPAENVPVISSTASASQPSASSVQQENLTEPVPGARMDELPVQPSASLVVAA